MKSAIKNYFGITKKEWNGLIVLMVIICLVLVAPYGFQYLHKDSVMDLNEFNKYAQQLNSAKDKQSAFAESNNNVNNASFDNKGAHPKMFVFNPNNLDAMQWQQLGLSQHQINIIKNYEAKGGYFYKKADVQKIYGITPDDYTRLQPYINLPDGENFSKKTNAIIEINNADSAQLTGLKGIGPSFAARIIKYRKQLGGFFKKEQLKEIYGIDSVKYTEIKDQVKINKARIIKININTATIDQLRPFPYLDFKQNNAIIQYRNQHGNYHTITDLQNIAILNNEILLKIAPYLSFK